METYILSRDGQELSRHATYLDAVGQLHRLQGQSVDWATKYEGYAITEELDEEYWEDWCEECNAEPDEPCAQGCVNSEKARCLK